MTGAAGVAGAVEPVVVLAGAVLLGALVGAVVAADEQAWIRIVMTIMAVAKIFRFNSLFSFRAIRPQLSRGMNDSESRASYPQTETNRNIERAVR